MIRKMEREWLKMCHYSAMTAVQILDMNILHLILQHRDSYKNLSALSRQKERHGIKELLSTCLEMHV